MLQYEGQGSIKEHKNDSGISLLNIPRKVCARVLTSRLLMHRLESNLSVLAKGEVVWLS